VASSIWAIRLSGLTETAIKESSTVGPSGGAVANLGVLGGHLYFDQGTGTGFQ
jgi:hypothetical protein